MITYLKTRAYRIALWRAINIATGNDSHEAQVHPINGLRVIKVFENMNPGTKFDPFDSSHVDKLRFYGRGLIACNAALAVTGQPSAFHPNRTPKWKR